MDTIWALTVGTIFGVALGALVFGGECAPAFDGDDPWMRSNAERAQDQYLYQKQQNIQEMENFNRRHQYKEPC